MLIYHPFHTHTPKIHEGNPSQNGNKCPSEVWSSFFQNIPIPCKFVMGIPLQKVVPSSPPCLELGQKGTSGEPVHFHGREKGCDVLFGRLQRGVQPVPPNKGERGNNNLVWHLSSTLTRKGHQRPFGVEHGVWDLIESEQKDGTTSVFSFPSRNLFDLSYSLTD